MTQVNIIQDLSALTRVPNKAITELKDREMLCISSAIHDAKKAGEDIAILNIGLGTLSVELDTMQCKFIPNRELKNYIKRGLTEAISPVEFELEQTIINKLLTICEETL